MTVAEVRETRVARSPAILVPLIQEDLRMGNEAGEPYYRAAGEKMIEAREGFRRPNGGSVRESEWTAWIKKHFDLSLTQAKVYTKLAEGTARRPFVSLRQSMGSKGTGKVTWQQPVAEVLNRVNYDALRLEQQAKVKEEKLTRQLGNQLIDIGYKVLATKLHPDKVGGSSEAMVRLNKVRALLRAAL